jgi:hypothetical protein
LHRRGKSLAFLVKLAPVCLFLLSIETLGALTGYLFGLGSASRRIAKIDFHREDYMNRRDRERFVEQAEP